MPDDLAVGAPRVVARKGRSIVSVPQAAAERAAAAHDAGEGAVADGLSRMLGAPEPLNPDHVIADFDCGGTSLNAWLQRRAMANQVSGASRSFVVCDGDHVVGYYALASSAVAPAAAPGRFKRNMPDPVPVVALGRLAVALSHRG